MLTLSRNRRYEIRCVAGATSPDLAFDVFLFLKPEHLATQSTDCLRVFELFDLKAGQVVALFPTFWTKDHQVYSPGRAPFGGLQVKPGLPAAILSEFLTAVHQYFVNSGNITGIRLKTCPLIYAPSENTLITNTLLRLGYEIEYSEVNHHIPVTDRSFAENLHASARRRLQKCHREKFTFQEEEAALLPSVFVFIKKCRTEKGHELSLSYEAMAALFRGFQDSFRIFSVRTAAGELAACTVTVRINQEVLYNFYPASPIRYNTFSPTIMLTEGLYQVCQQEKFSLLDLGTSMLENKPNFPLITFKKHLGGEAGLKLTFSFGQA